MPPRDVDLPLFPLQTRAVSRTGCWSSRCSRRATSTWSASCLRERQPLRRGLPAPRAAKCGATARRCAFESLGTLAAADRRRQRAGRHPAGALPRHAALRRRRDAASRPTACGSREATPLDDDAVVAADAGAAGTVRGLANAIATLKAQGAEPFLQPYRFDDAGWVANRWCEILPIPLAAKQKLMELPDPQLRLRLVDEFLRGKGVRLSARRARRPRQPVRQQLAQRRRQAQAPAPRRRANQRPVGQRAVDRARPRGRACAPAASSAAGAASSRGASARA